MKQRGFSVIELLVALAMLLTFSTLVYEGVRPQTQNASNQVRIAAMQQSTRGAFDLMARDIRMAGYGVDMTMPGSPPTIARDPSTGAITLYGNYTNVKTTGSGAGSMVTVPSSTGFKPNNYLVIRSFLGGEAAKIASVGSTTIFLATALVRTYPAGSEVSQIEKIVYSTSGYTGMRDGQPMIDGLTSSSVKFYLDSGTLVSVPDGNERNLRTALIAMNIGTVSAQGVGQSAYGGDSMDIGGEVRIRNLGLLKVVR